MNPAFFRLALDFSVEHLHNELKVCEEEHWISHYNRQDYTGSWSSISLRSVSGASEDICPFSNKTYIDTPLLEKCPYFKEVAARFECEKEAIRLLRLEPGSKIKEHTDPISYEDGFFRIHIPIITNEQITFSVNKELVPMKAGECWYANFGLPHSVENNSDAPRVHLVIDCRRNEWSDSIFSKAGFDLNAVSERYLLDDKTKLLVIEELLRNPTETNLKIVETLRNELAAA